MSRREEMENIIIGTLLESNKERNFFDDCRSAIVPDMFSNDTNRRIFTMIVEMNGKGMKETDPCSIFMEYGEKVLDIVADMAGLCADWSFIHLKTKYNETMYIESLVNGTDYRRTDVKFEDYVKQFIALVYS